MPKPILKTKDFRSSSSSRMYTAIEYRDGTMSCNCPGWTRRVDVHGGRTCKHCEQMAVENTQAFQARTSVGAIKAMEERIARAVLPPRQVDSVYAEIRESRSQRQTASSTLPPLPYPLVCDQTLAPYLPAGTPFVFDNDGRREIRIATGDGQSVSADDMLPYPMAAAGVVPNWNREVNDFAQAQGLTRVVTGDPTTTVKVSKSKAAKASPKSKWTAEQIAEANATAKAAAKPKPKPIKRHRATFHLDAAVMVSKKEVDDDESDAYL